jgi:hypothetical protein
MFSYSQVRQKVTEWMGVEVIMNMMYPNSCIAYTGPFKETCWDKFRYEISNGKVKVPAQ